MNHANMILIDMILGQYRDVYMILIDMYDHKDLFGNRNYVHKIYRIHSMVKILKSSNLNLNKSK